MPYAIRGNTVVKKDTGEVVGHSDDPKKYIRTLRAVEHGWKPGKSRTGMYERFNKLQKAGPGE